MKRKGVSAPLVTAVCHTYNQRGFVKYALNGIFSQKCSFEYEVIVNDDASTDGTDSEVERLTLGRDNVHFIRHTENQFSQGRRPPYFTFRAARGRYLAFCEGDDYWSDPEKLEKQVEALESRPECDLCVHPALRISMNSGKEKRAFFYGDQEQLIDVETVIGRHNQFAPTASMLMRSEAAQRMPRWFFDEPGLPFGDFFLEAILGRKGVLYLPDTMSVYRRGVTQSYTERFMNAGGESLERSMENAIYFMDKLNDVGGIPRDSLEKRRSYVILNYALQFLAAGDIRRFRSASRRVKVQGNPEITLCLALLRSNQLFFQGGRWAFRRIRALRS